MNKIIVKTADFHKHFAEIEYIRNTVFIREQNVPVDLEWDKLDNEATHILAYYNNKAVGTARLLNDGHIGRMAVLKDYRNRKVGENMLKYILTIAAKKAMERVELSAQEHAINFYKKYGFFVISDVYMDAGIPHYSMRYKGNC